LYYGYIVNVFIENCEQGCQYRDKPLEATTPWHSVGQTLGLGADQGAKRIATWPLVCPVLGTGKDQERKWGFGCHTHKQAAQASCGSCFPFSLV